MRRGLPVGSRARELAEDLHVALDDVRSLGELCLARGVELELGRVDHDVCAGQVAHLVELGRRPRRLDRAPPAENHDLADPRADDGFDRLVGRVGRRQLLLGEREHPRDVERDVAVADHDHALGRRKVEIELLVVGMAVVPGDELRGRPRAAQILAGNAESPVGGRAIRVDHRVVETGEVVVREIAPDLDIPEEAEARAARRSSRTPARPSSAADGPGRRRAAPGPTASAGARSCPPRARLRAVGRRHRSRRGPNRRPQLEGARSCARSYEASESSRSRSRRPRCLRAALRPLRPGTSGRSRRPRRRSGSRS